MESLRLTQEEITNTILNVERASDFLKKRGWKIEGMPGSGFEPSNNLYSVIDETGENTGIYFRPYTHTDNMRGVWLIDGRQPEEYPSDSWSGRGWESFDNIDDARSEMERYKIYGLDFRELPSEASKRLRAQRNVLR